MVIEYPPNENETLYYYPSQAEPSSRTSIFDTKDCFRPKLKHKKTDCLFDFKLEW